MKLGRMLLVGWVVLAAGCATPECGTAPAGKAVVYEYQYVPGYWVAPRHLWRPVAGN